MSPNDDVRRTPSDIAQGGCLHRLAHAPPLTLSPSPGRSDQNNSDDSIVRPPSVRKAKCSAIAGEVVGVKSIQPAIFHRKATAIPIDAMSCQTSLDCMAAHKVAALWTAPRSN